MVKNTQMGSNVKNYLTWNFTVANFYQCLKVPEMKILKNENFEKLILLKLADKVSFHVNISSTMKKNPQNTCISFGSKRRKMSLCYLLFYLVL